MMKDNKIQLFRIVKAFTTLDIFSSVMEREFGLARSNSCVAAEWSAKIRLKMRDILPTGSRAAAIRYQIEAAWRCCLRAERVGQFLHRGALALKAGGDRIVERARHALSPRIASIMFCRCIEGPQLVVTGAVGDRRMARGAVLGDDDGERSRRFAAPRQDVEDQIGARRAGC
ncbi:hypothetical protein [Sphingopyxis sp. BE122]|uniref:hypothetical protein n=2 Tax=Sphingopyxis TaxID=165697 RepID=UPI00286B81DF|nr:hypothetical protein [Sphingopyxis sp. BE122]